MLYIEYTHVGLTSLFFSPYISLYEKNHYTSMMKIRSQKLERVRQGNTFVK